MLKAKPEAQTHSQQGTLLHKENQWDKALAEYDQALALYPRYPEVYYNRGLAYRQKNDPAKAIADYKPRHPPGLRPTFRPMPTAAMPTTSRDRMEKALADYNKILALDPNPTPPPNKPTNHHGGVNLSPSSHQKRGDYNEHYRKESLGKTPEICRSRTCTRSATRMACG